MTRTRLTAGFLWGVGATLVMSVFLVVGYATGLSPMPQPIPEAVVSEIVGTGLPKPLLMGLTVSAHLLYGGVSGALLATVTEPVTLTKGIGFGIGLWLVMQIIFLPFVGWGLFGIAVTLRIAVATLVLHLIYGSVLGMTLNRDQSIGFGESVPT